MPARIEVKLIGLLSGVLVLLQTATLAAVHFAGERNLHRGLAEELRVGARVFDQLLSDRGRQLAETVRVLAADFAFRETVASGDLPTITSALANHGARIGAEAVFLVSLDGSVEADTLGGRFVGGPFPAPELVESAVAEGETSAVVSFDHRPYQFVVVEVLAPEPIALVSIGFPIRESELQQLRRLTGLDVALWSRSDGSRDVGLISTLAEEARRELPRITLAGGARDAPAGEAVGPHEGTVRLGGHEWESVLRPLPTADGSRIEMLLLRSIEEARRPLRRLELSIFTLSGAALAIALVTGVFFARTVSRPLQRLAEGAQRIERGDYSLPVAIDQDDEIGRLARAFDDMQVGIREREERIRFQATHDSLTGLPNRALFLDRLQHGIAQCKRRGGLVGMVMMDVDRFKEINDTLGHSVGDALLDEIGRRLMRTTRASDTVARLGGDEFAIMFEAEERGGALEVARRISYALEVPFTLGGISVDVSASMGIALSPLHAEDADTLLKHADVAMYDAKRNHQRVSIYEPGRDEHSLRRLSILSELRHAIADDQLELYFQPKVELATMRPVHVEALVRWQHPVHGTMAPGEFVPLAEQSGVVGLITKWVLREAVRVCGGWNRSGLDLSVAVNLSALDLYDSELPTLISGLLHEAGLDPGRLVLEITESAVMRDVPRSLRILGELSARGIAMAIDDYGTGYSSLAHLKRLPVDELKIDKSFVIGLRDPSSEDGVIVRSTIELGHNMGLRVAAEGVEHPTTWRILGDSACDLAQGFYLSPPLPAAALLEWMRTNTRVGQASSGDGPADGPAPSAAAP
jgi:diguanylate cyclase (GGDEF)-like protein